MCRNIRPLFSFPRPASPEEVEAARRRERNAKRFGPTPT